MDDNNVRTAADLGAANVGVQTVGQVPFAVVPAGYTLQNLEEQLAQPTRKRGTLHYGDVDSFCRAVADHAGDNTRLYADMAKPEFRAVFNDHGQVDAGWRDHVAVYACPLSVEWRTWLASNKKAMTQEAFAQFIEDNAPDCVAPDAATMIEISRTLEAKKKVSFASAIRLSNGEHVLSYEEEISGTAAKGKLTVPDVFSIGIAVLEGGPRYALNARLRYRIADKGVLSLWYDLERPHKVIEDAVREVRDLISAETAMPIYRVG